MRWPTSIWLPCFLPALIWACRDPYTSPYKAPATGYLVIEGYICGNTPTQFTLTRTLPLPGDSTLPTVDGATVQIEGSDNSTYTLADMGNGIYSSNDTLPLNTLLEYRLRVQTPNGEQYLSDFVSYQPTPPIDSINWVNNGDNSVTIYANTHNTNDTVGYYQWTYSDIYEHDATFESHYYYSLDSAVVLPRTLSNQIFRCWTASTSSDIIIGTSLKLGRDLIYEQPIKMIPPNDIQLSVLYTILVRQYVLTAGGYNFLQLMHQNTESLGSIFDAQPTQLTGNIHCLNNPAEKVIGWVSAGTEQEQRIWIYRWQVPSYYGLSCAIPDTVIPNNPGDLYKDFGSGIFTPIDQVACGGAFCWLSNYSSCLNCTVQGGTEQKPSIWPN